MRKLLIEDSTGEIVNIIMVEDGADWVPPIGHSVIDEIPEAVIGGTWDGTKLRPPPDTAPPSKELRVRELIMKLKNDTATLPEIRELLRLERGL